MRDDGAFLGKTFNMFSFFGNITERDEQRKISVITKAQTDLLKWMREASNKTTVIEESING